MISAIRTSVGCWRIKSLFSPTLKKIAPRVSKPKSKISRFLRLKCKIYTALSLCSSSVFPIAVLFEVGPLGN